MSEYKKYITDNLVNLTTQTRCTTIVLNNCLQSKILSEYEVDWLQRLINTKQDSASEFWKLIQKRVNCFKTLIRIFREENQSEIVDILEKAVRDDGSDQKYNFITNLKPLKVKIEKPTETKRHKNDGYKLNPKKIGGALLINVTVFDDARQNRDGALKDSDYMEKLWHGLKYTVTSQKGKITKTNLLDDIVPEFLSNFEPDMNPNWQSCVVFVGTHGTNGTLTMSDGQVVDIYTELISKFVDCSDLKGKPKIFIFQSCQVITGDIINQPRISDKKDLILCFPTVPGDWANWDDHLGSWFIYTLADVFMRKAHELELREMLQEVQKTMITELNHEEKFEQVSYWIDFKELKPLYFNVAP